MLGLFLAMLLITNYGMSAYIYRIPQTAEIEGVSLSHRARWYREGDRRSDVFVRTPEGIENAKEIHRMILENRGYLRNAHWRLAINRSANYQNVPVTYLLNDGTIIRRNYTFTQNFVEQSGLNEFMHSRDVVVAENPTFRNLYMIEEIYVYFWVSIEANGSMQREEVWSVSISNPAEIRELAAAIIEDSIRENEIRREYNAMERAMDDPEFYISFSLWLPPEYGIWWMWMPTLRSDMADYTLQWLERR